MGCDRRSCERAERSTELRAAGNMMKEKYRTHRMKQKAGSRGIKSVCGGRRVVQSFHFEIAEHNDLGLTKSDIRR
jgi:hypothetical protein